jgi:hypothetical protein
MSKEDGIRKFNELVPKAAKVHPETWCFKRFRLIPTGTLKGEECYNCKSFILNGGICDPL